VMRAVSCWHKGASLLRLLARPPHRRQEGTDTFTSIGSSAGCCYCSYENIRRCYCYCSLFLHILPLSLVLPSSLFPSSSCSFFIHLFLSPFTLAVLPFFSCLSFYLYSTFRFFYCLIYVVLCTSICFSLSLFLIFVQFIS
jgi:hypothetical protein